MRPFPWQDGVLIAASGWLFFSPMFLGFATLAHPAAWVAFICAIALFVSAAEALVVPDTLEDWLDGGVGLALLASPWVLRYSDDPFATANAVVVGLVVIGSAAAALARDRREHVLGHQWASPA